MTKGRGNKPGQRMEAWVGDVIEDLGYIHVPSGRFFAARSLGQPIYARQCEVGTDIYAKRRRVDFILYHPQRWRDCLVIQCKWQASKGSVEEKYPFEVLSVAINQRPTIVVLDGGGYSPGAERWLKDQVGQQHLVRVCDLGEFSRLASRGGL